MGHRHMCGLKEQLAGFLQGLEAKDTVNLMFEGFKKKTGTGERMPLLLFSFSCFW